MSWLGRIAAEFTIQEEEPVVRRSQLQSLTKQLPLLYVTLCTNAIALAFTHFLVAPYGLTLLLPAILVPVCAVRVVAWRRLVVDTLSDSEITFQLRRTMILVGVLGVSFTGWSLSLFSYGDDYARAHVAFFMSITAVGCIFCLIHLRPAALALMAIVIIPFTIRFITTGSMVLTAIAINFLIVSIVMTFMLLAYYDEFRDRVRSRDELAKISDEHRQAAEIDGLTGLASRRRFFQDLAEVISVSEAEQTSFALGLVDLDGFKPINDLHGHQIGDDVLVEVSRRMESCAGDLVKIARLGGDEFALIVPQRLVGGVQRLGEALCQTISVPMPLACGVVRVAASMGFAVYPAMGRTKDQLFERADFALYHAKDHDRGTAVVFSETHAGEIRDRRQLDHELRNADVDREFFVVFQPIVDIVEDRVIAFEALARWQSPALGAVSPGAFIPAAERLGLVRMLTRSLFKKACAAAHAWPTEVRLSFNLSIDDLMDERAGERLVSMVADAGIPPQRLIFEVTETAVMHDFARARIALDALRARGCGVALDDFGTGYSSLSYVHRLPLDKLKIDRSFVQSLASERASRSIIASIVDLSKNLDLHCIVEGVETLEQVELLRSIGCTVMQGFLFGRPMPTDSVQLLLEKERGVRTSALHLIRA